MPKGALVDRKKRRVALDRVVTVYFVEQLWQSMSAHLDKHVRIHLAGRTAHDYMATTPERLAQKVGPN